MIWYLQPLYNYWVYYGVSSMARMSIFARVVCMPARIQWTFFIATAPDLQCMHATVWCSIFIIWFQIGPDVIPSKIIDEFLGTDYFYFRICHNLTCGPYMNFLECLCFGINFLFHQNIWVTKLIDEFWHDVHTEQ